MNIKQIETFAAVMRSGTASRAAEVLGVTQPAVSRSLAELERALGFALFDRVRNRLIATPEARQFFREVEATFRGVDALRAAAARIRDRGSGELRVASLSVLGNSVVPRATALFLQQHPTVTVTLHVLMSRDVRALVAAGDFDVGLAADEIDLTGVSSQVFAAPRALCALPASHPLIEREVIRPGDLDGIPIVAYVPEDRARQRMDRIFASASVLPRIAVETVYASTVCALVAEGAGVGFVSPHAMVGLDRDRLALRRFEPALQIRSYLILPPDRPKSQLVRSFVAALLACR